LFFGALPVIVADAALARYPTPEFKHLRLIQWDAAIAAKED